MSQPPNEQKKSFAEPMLFAESSLSMAAIPTKQEVVSVPIRSIERAIDEAAIANQMTKFGGFCLTGSIWLGVERLITEVYVNGAGLTGQNWGDTLFLVCLVFAVMGGLIYHWGCKAGKLNSSGLRDFLPKVVN